ncbi:MAG: gamma-glutamyltransferase [Gammaproteobacteria bacterium]|nr:gamma-glutamyltransferase [Gammaproteobacteria bacterium]
MVKHAAKVISLVLFATVATQVTASQIADNEKTGFQPAVASAHPLATQAGIEILKMGGNAFDAAVAVSAALAVVEPYGSGLGGGGFWLLHIAKDHDDVMIDGRERAPLAARRDMYLDENGDVISGASINGPLAAGIPGTVAALEKLAKQYGSLPLSTTLAAAIRYAREGFTVDQHYKEMATHRQSALLASFDAAEIFLRDDLAPDTGEIIIQSDLAKTLELIAKDGAKAFYTGELAKKMVASVNQHGGQWSMQDLADYKVVERSPEVIVYKGMRLVTASPPSSGGMALAEMLNMLSFFKLEKMQLVERIHVLTEVMRRAYRDRAEHLGDPDFIDVPTDLLTSSVYTNKLVKSINRKKATPSATLKPVGDPMGNGVDTTHFSIIDAEGNRVSATMSINYPFGSGFVAEGTGVLLNDEMDDFSVKPGVPNVYGLVGAEANSIAPGKRMLSSMSPSFLETSDRIAVLGTPGGSRIISMVLLSMLDFYQGGDAESMVKLGRFHHQYLPDKISYEPGVFDTDVVEALMAMGHQLEALSGTYGNMHVVVANKKNYHVEAASDSRGQGQAIVLQ